jgi:RnfABCDGE-type electron transport complex G subunit
MALPNSVRFPLTLAVIAAIAGGGLAFVEVGTKKRVEENKQRKLSAAFKEVPGFESSREIEVSKAFRKKHKYPKNERAFELLGAGGERIGYAAQVRCVKPTCYNGTDPIVLVVALDQKLEKVLVVRTTNNKETPGLGTRVSEKAPRESLLSMARVEKVDPPKSDYEFLDRFKDKSVGELEIKRGVIDGITGATVSSKAVAGGARRAVEFLKAVLAEEK